MIRKEIAQKVHARLPKEVEYFRCAKCHHITYSRFDSVDCVMCGKKMEGITREKAIEALTYEGFGGC